LQQTNNKQITNQQQTNNKPATTENKDKESIIKFNKEINNIIDYLNKILKTNYKPTTKKTKDVIIARLNEGFEFNDFKKVIDIKVAEWQKDVKMSKFLRPETLFGNKFEGYLNQVQPNTPGKITKSSSHNDPNYYKAMKWNI
jgi:uncharacterized phage protein (TIGR02220 family)